MFRSTALSISSNTRLVSIGTTRPLSSLTRAPAILSSTHNARFQRTTDVCHKHKLSTTSRGFSATSAKCFPVISYPLADIGEGIYEVEILSWDVKVGDEVAEFQKLCEVQSDKANVDITSRYSGRIVKLHHSVGSMAKIGAPLIDIDTEHADAIEEHGNSQSSSTQSPVPSGTRASSSREVLTTPAVRHLARQHGIDLSNVVGTGKGGRIMKQDVLSFVGGGSSSTRPATTARPASGPSPVAPAPQPAAPITPAPQPTAAPTAPTASIQVSSGGPKGTSTRVEIRGIARAMFKSMTAANEIPQFLLTDEIDVTELVALRGDLKAILEQDGEGSLSFTPIFVKAASMALKQFPILNSSIAPDQSHVIQHSEHNIGVAMDTKHGLLVPNIKGVNNRSIREIARELRRLQASASEGKLSVEDTTGGTFSISNVGMIAGIYASPVVFPPEVAIGAIGKIQRLPRYDASGNVVPRDILTVSWSADHRIIEGAVMARYQKLFKSFLESPKRMFLDL